MVFTEVIKAIEEFSADQLRQLREYIQQREQQIELKAGTLNVDELLEGLAEIRSGLSDEQFSEIERAMNDEYIEPLDNDQ
ncbi:MAG: hypothetical protein MUF87_19415 [Anaerolineae bacterium]|jgi:hypothetical protein|nr:hypothetical protein [Anaerolineae bacterium]